MRTAATTVAAFALAMLAVCEVGLFYPVAWWLYLSVAVLFGAALLRPRTLRTQRMPVSAFALVLALIAALHFVDWSTRKPFLRDLARVRIGMTEDEVRQVMAGYMEGTGWPAMPDRREAEPSATPAESPSRGELAIPNSLVFRHSNESAFNSDWAVITISDGKVVSVNFSPD